VAPTDTTVVFDLALDPSVSVGIHGIRAVGEVAMSELKLVVVDTLPRSVETGNNVATTPQKLTLPFAVSGFILPEETDYYLVDANAGQRVTIEVVGHRLGTPLDPLVRIVAPDGKELLTHDNDDGFDYDFRFPVTFPAAGPYRIEIRDARYQGGLWPYVLRVGDFPAVRVGYPTAPKEGELVALLGPGSREVPPILNDASSTLGPSRSLIAAGPQGSAWVTISSESNLNQKEIEPNNTLADANRFEIGRSIEGRLEYLGDVDAYGVKLSPQQSIHVRVVTRRLGSPLDAYLRLADPSGNEVASADDQADDDAELNFTAPAEGNYTLFVEDLNRRGGSDFVYRLQTASPRRDYLVRPAVEQVIIPRGTSMPIVLAADRVNVDEPIDVVLSNPVEGITARPCRFERGSPATVLVLDAVDGPPVPPMCARFVSHLADKPGETPARFPGVLLTPLSRPKLDQIVLYPPTLETAFAIATVERPFFRLTLSPLATGVARHTTMPIEVHAVRDKFADEPIQLAVENLPANIVVAPAPIEKGKRSVSLNVQSNPGAPLGSFPIWVSGTSTFAGRSVRVASEVVLLVVRPAVALTLASAETTIEIGKKAAVAVKADRLGGVGVPIPVTWPNLPAGITASAATIPEGAGEIMVELSADPTVAAGTHEGIVARSTYGVNGQQETVDSPPMRLVISPAKP
jgi:hypothetical protein